MAGDDELQNAVVDMAEVDRLTSAGQWDEAIAIVRRARDRLRAASRPSAWACWRLAAMLDTKGDPLEALPFAREARQIDPGCPTYKRSHEIILERLLEVLKDTKDPEIALTIYGELLHDSAADRASHLVIARVHHAAGRHDQALRLLDAMEILLPALGEALALKAEVLLALGRVVDARLALLRALALAGESSMGAEPTQALGQA